MLTSFFFKQENAMKWVKLNKKSPKQLLYIEGCWSDKQDRVGYLMLKKQC